MHIKDSLIQKYGISKNDYKVPTSHPPVPPALQVIEVLMEERKPHKSGPQWKFAGSLYFAFVSLSLIGEQCLLQTARKNCYWLDCTLGGTPVSLYLEVELS